MIYAGLRAQGKGLDKKDSLRTTRSASFILGFPTTIIPLYFIRENSCEIFGVELPRNRK